MKFVQKSCNRDSNKVDNQFDEKLEMFQIWRGFIFVVPLDLSGKSIMPKTINTYA